ncbi:hypothetical protein SSP531S_39710 [Streptomyces spongiicola]|uniref:Uncharacterized protein n=1 Tax=Streptomyces spongiicola TaxID=1690221 RepID=A0A388T2W4_9ACTN|nr:hypothetical protein SSP531S_39710 [Streptomyces spongiicola]
MTKWGSGPEARQPGGATEFREGEEREARGKRWGIPAARPVILAPRSCGVNVIAGILRPFDGRRWLIGDARRPCPSERAGAFCAFTWRCSPERTPGRPGEPIAE